MSELALDLPACDVNVSSALIDLQSIPSMTPGGLAQLQTFSRPVSGTTQFRQSITDTMRNAVQDLQTQVAGWQSNRINQLTIPLAIVITSIIILIRMVFTFTGLFSNIAARRAAKIKANQ